MKERGEMGRDGKGEKRSVDGRGKEGKEETREKDRIKKKRLPNLSLSDPLPLILTRDSFHPLVSPPCSFLPLQYYTGCPGSHTSSP